jgi:hypothetical protein
MAARFCDGIRRRQAINFVLGRVAGVTVEAISKYPLIVAADVSRLTFPGFCMSLERTHVRCYKF